MGIFIRSQQNALETKRTLDVARLIFAIVLLILLLVAYLITKVKDPALATIFIGSFSSVLSITIGILIGEASQG